MLFHALINYWQDEVLLILGNYVTMDYLIN